MNLEDLLSELRFGILHDRSDRESGTSDYLWTDETLVRYINEAQRRFATRSLVIRDGTTPEVCEVELVEGQTEYSLHCSVIAVISAKLDMDDAPYDLTRVGHSILNNYRTIDTPGFDPNGYVALAPGRVVAYGTDEYVSGDDNDSQAVVTLRVYPEPDEDMDGETVKLRVVRKPLNAFNTNNLAAYPEIPEDHHLEMLDWAAYLALRIVDTDAGNPKRAAEFASSFEQHVRAARTLVLRKLFAPMPWGSGRNGWTWGS